MRKLHRFTADESGQTVVEYALVVVVILLASYLIMQAIGDELSNILNEILSILRQVLRPATPPVGG
ncbi:MAG TPA: Flp family type IVb pilin [Anaerolineae bacterium]|nr:Flp family type IVb pilin [Anaerolineae bacterium]